MIAIIDYGMGNLGSVLKGFEKVGCDARIVTNAAEMDNASGIVLPGVGACAAAMQNLDAAGLIDPILSQIKSGKPFLGICLGLQMLFEKSEEGAGSPCLGLFKGRVVKFEGDMKIPHMGWNQLHFKNRGAVGVDIPEDSFFYFVHSYYVAPEDESITMATTDYGIDFVSAITWQNVTATQFHPEKSQKLGLRMLENFGRLANS
jgi:imidazole glycerol-phosphate synthase subunit HisH